MDQPDHGLASDPILQREQQPVILQRQSEDLIVQRIDGMAVFPGIDVERTAAAESASGRGVAPGIQVVIQRILTEPEIVSPMQESVDPGEVKQHACDPVPERRQAEGTPRTSGHIAGIVAPALPELFLFEIRKMLKGGNRYLQQIPPAECDIGQGVHDGKSRRRQTAVNQFRSKTVNFQIRLGRLVRKMEIHLAGESFSFQKTAQFRQQRGQELPVQR